MRRILSLAAILTAGLFAAPSSAGPAGKLPSLPAFPGAEGGGAFTPGGRGGKVCEVTSLADDGPGTLRAACAAEGPRTVVFRVAGIITLASPLKINHPFITIAGQSAPGDGVCVRGATTEINTHDVIIRHMRFRRGDMKVRDDALGGNPVGNVIVDHVSASWGLDENLSLYRYMKKDPSGGPDKKMPVENLTIQWCISSEALDKNNHAFGGTWGGVNSSFHHNLFACNTGRNPSIGMTGGFDFRNNVLFNWRHRTIDGGDGMSRINVVANYFKPGPITKGELRHRIAKADRRRGPGPDAGVGKWFVADNYVVDNPQVSADNWAGGVQYAHDVTIKGELVRSPTEAEARATAPFPAPPITQQTAEEAYELILANAGATLPHRDPVDLRVIEMVRTGKVTFKDGIIISPADVGGWPEYKADVVEQDSDHDGIPDWWELKYGLNPNDASDASKDLNSDGYTNLEKYLNGIDPTKKVDYRDPANNKDTLTAARLAKQAGK
jgi:pectate lyase